MVGYSGGTSSKEATTAEKFTYQVIKEAITRMTVNKYELESIKLQSSYDDCDYNTYSRQYVVKVYENGYEELESIGDPTLVETRNEKTTEKKINGTEQYNYETFWYVAEAITYDRIINNSFSYEKYNSSDVENLINPDSNNLISTVEINELSEEISPIIVNQNAEVPSENAPYNTVVRTNRYIQKEGVSYIYEKEWKDKLSVSNSSNEEYDYNTAKNFNTTNDEKYSNIKTNKIIISEDKFVEDNPEGSGLFDRLTKEDTINNLNGMSIIDLMNSNSGIYNEYIRVNSDYSEYQAISRNNLRPAYNQIKNIINILVKRVNSENPEDNTEIEINSYTTGHAVEGAIPFVYGSSLGYDVTDISLQSTTTSTYMSGMDLLRQYIFSHEGIGPAITQNADGADCYTAYDDGAGNITIGHGINLSGNPKYMQQLEAEYGTITVGTLIPVESVETIENEMVKSYYDKVKNGTNGLDLEEYQIHALTSFAYNYQGINFSEFTRYYNDQNYWNQETDNRYEEVYEKYKDNQTAVSQIQAEADLTTGMYEEFFAPVVYSDGELLQGLVRRRKSEYILFSLGYYDTLQRFWSLGGSNLPGIELLNADGTINYDNVKELQLWYEQDLFIDGPTTSLNPQPSSIYKYGDNSEVSTSKSTNLSKAITEEYRMYFNATGSSSSPDYPKVIPINTYFQCTWWAESMAYYFLYSSSGGEISEPIGKGNALGDGAQVASNMSKIYGVPTYRVDELEVGKHYVFSINNHVVYVEAVGNTEIVVSHCGSGTNWFGVSAVSRNSSQINGTYVCMEDILATYGF